MISCVALACAVSVVYITVSVGKANRELVADERHWLNDTRAFLAAESGLLMLTDWAIQSAAEGDIFPQTSSITLDGISVALAVERAGGDLPPDHWRLISTAIMPELPYDKRVEWVLEGAAPPPKGYKTARRARPDSGYDRQSRF
jgi:hypothetical protein